MEKKKFIIHPERKKEFSEIYKHPAYYQRFGFKAIQQYGIRQIDLAEELQPYFMGFELIPDSLKNMNRTINLHA